MERLKAGSGAGSPPLAPYREPELCEKDPKHSQERRNEKHEADNLQISREFPGRRARPAHVQQLWPSALCVGPALGPGALAERTGTRGAGEALTGALLHHPACFSTFSSVIVFLFDKT